MRAVTHSGHEIKDTITATATNESWGNVIEQVGGESADLHQMWGEKMSRDTNDQLGVCVCVFVTYFFCASIVFIVFLLGIVISTLCETPFR